MAVYDDLAEKLIRDHRIVPGVGGAIPEVFFIERSTTLNDLVEAVRPGFDMCPKILADVLLSNGFALVTPKGRGDEILYAVISISDGLEYDVTGRYGERLTTQGEVNG